MRVKYCQHKNIICRYSVFCNDADDLYLIKMYKVIFSRFGTYSEMREIFARITEYYSEMREIFERDGKYFRDPGDFAKDTGNISASRDLFVFGIVCG